MNTPVSEFAAEAPIDILPVVAEFVENEAQMEMLRALGVDFVQGYAIERPGPVSTTAS